MFHDKILARMSKPILSIFFSTRKQASSWQMKCFKKRNRTLCLHSFPRSYSSTHLQVSALPWSIASHPSPLPSNSYRTLCLYCFSQEAVPLLICKSLLCPGSLQVALAHYRPANPAYFARLVRSTRCEVRRSFVIFLSSYRLAFYLFFLVLLASL